ncbi:MAG: TetR/AcrR family transcriptional regulator [Desulfovibrionales bacterium]|nr:TetR/AcrR family transcriptional regulator [Desulfovibrionales bacterium]
MKDWTPEQTEKRRMILDAARELFSKEGVSNVSMRRIAAKVNYSPALIYRYVKNKEELLDQLRTEGYQILLNRMARVDVTKDPLDHLTDLAVEYVKFGVDYWEYYDLMFHMPLQIDENGACPIKGYEAVLDMIRTAVVRAIKAGFFKGAAPDTALFMCWGQAHGLLSLYISKRIPFHAGTDRAKTLLEEIPRTFLRLAATGTE